MRIFLPILFGLWGNYSYSQPGDTLVQSTNKVSSSPKVATVLSTTKPPFKPEIFTNGFIDILNSGQVNASARFVRILIGEPGKFALPLSLFSGVSANNFQSTSLTSSKTNESLVTNFINPLTGIANISIDGVGFRKKDEQKVTKFGLLYHVGERVLNGRKVGLIADPSTGKPINFLNSYATLGLYFQTGAWDKNNSKNLGVCWFALRYIGCYTNPNQLAEMMPDIQTNGFYYGYSIAWGIEISNALNTKVVYYKYTKKPEIEYYLPIYQFSFNYTLKK
jgi:hypothetical protein